MSGTHKPNWKIAIGIPVVIFSSCFFITLTTKFKANTELLSNAILIDILVVAPLIYLLAIRKTRISRLSVSRVFIVGLFVAGLILNVHSNPFLQFIKTWISPLIELVVISFIVSKFYIANKKAKKVNNKSLDFLMHCRAVMYHVIGNEKFSNIIASEIAVLYYAFIGGKDKTIDNETKFSVYKENGVTMVLWVILSIFLIETAGMHFLIVLWSKTVAWIVTALSFYTCIQLYAHIRAIKARPTILNIDSLEIHNGLAGDAYIEFGNIEKFELSKKIPKGRNSAKISLLKGLENHNVVVYLKTPIQVTKIFGIKREADTVLFYVDKAKDFSNALNCRLSVASR
ncbi:MAG TPA: hypothetical protein VN726_13805 [Hanamia sp.]|nr:hypothetical protein [Hanamia sp.]